MDNLTVKVYFESKSHAELVAVMSEDLYNQLTPTLEKIAAEANMIVTESIEDEEAMSGWNGVHPFGQS